MNTFYKAGRALLKRTDMTPAEKLVRIVRDHWLAFEGREPTTAEVARATGMSERHVYRIFTPGAPGQRTQRKTTGVGEKEKGRLTGCQAKPLTGCHDRMSAKTDKMSVPGPDACSKSYSFSRDVDKGERRTAPLSPLAAQGGKKETACGVLALLHLKAVDGSGKWSLARWIGQVEEDEAARRYTREDLEAFVASRTSITEAPWLLADSVRRHAEATHEAAFRERIRVIRAEGLTDVRWKGEGEPTDNLPRRGRVKYADPDAGLLVLVFRISLGGGRSYERFYEIRRPEDLAGWRFRPEQPVLPFAAETA
jgi:hypothetical protein